MKHNQPPENDSHEQLSDEARRFKDAIDSKFDQVKAAEGSITGKSSEREHEQTVTLDTAAFPHASPEARIQATRPIPEEAEAAEQWTVFGGHRIEILDPRNQLQQVYLIVDGQLGQRYAPFAVDPIMYGLAMYGSVGGSPMNNPDLAEELIVQVENAAATNAAN